MNSRKTVLEILQSTTGYFQKHGVENPRLNAEHLLAHVLKLKRIDLYLEFDRELFEDELAPLRELVRKRGQGTPLQHLLGTVEFYGREFACDARALIPRPETEHLIEVLLPLVKASNGRRLIDVGTGTGVIALTLAAELPEAEVYAVDVSNAALALAQENATKLALSERVRFIKGDLLSDIDGPFDWIVANLPYIPSDDIPTLSPEVQFDPVSALDGGADGLDLIRKLILQASHKLTPNGGIALEIGHDQSERAFPLLEAANFRDIRIVKDYQGVPRFLIAHYG
ncbi:MAG TPA: peptide chain release factor N(5)-glutamine methyltransferase [Chthoniobacterales bacterium]